MRRIPFLYLMKVSPKGGWGRTFMGVQHSINKLKEADEQELAEQLQDYLEDAHLAKLFCGDKMDGIENKERYDHAIARFEDADMQAVL